MNRNGYRIFAKFFFAMYILYLLYLTLFSSYYGRNYFHRNINLFPFKTMVEYLHSNHSIKSIIINLLGNIAAFLPMGLLLPLIFKKINSFKRVTIFIFLSSFTIEITQYILGVGTTDIDDIILNILGGILGFCLYNCFKEK